MKSNELDDEITYHKDEYIHVMEFAETLNSLCVIDNTDGFDWQYIYFEYPKPTAFWKVKSNAKL